MRSFKTEIEKKRGIYLIEKEKTFGPLESIGNAIQLVKRKNLRKGQFKVIDDTRSFGRIDVTNSFEIYLELED